MFPEVENLEPAELVEVEEYGRRGGTDRLPAAKLYVIRVDKEKFTVSWPSLTGRAILELAGKTPPERYKLTQKLHGGGAHTVGLDDVVDLRAPGIERFMTLRRDHTEG
jgi:hypothetical protein